VSVNLFEFILTAIVCSPDCLHDFEASYVTVRDYSF